MAHKLDTAYSDNHFVDLLCSVLSSLDLEFDDTRKRLDSYTSQASSSSVSTESSCHEGKFVERESSAATLKLFCALDLSDRDSLLSISPGLRCYGMKPISRPWPLHEPKSSKSKNTNYQTPAPSRPAVYRALLGPQPSNMRKLVPMASASNTTNPTAAESIKSIKKSSLPKKAQAAFQKSKPRLLATSLYCKFCKCNGEVQETYTSHVLHDPFGAVSCPVLLNYTCSTCGNRGGPNAHTLKYCPVNREANDAFGVPQKLLSERNASGRRVYRRRLL